MPRTVKCPNCRKEASWDDNPHRPFCSDRCRLIDLGAWMQERYRVPAGEIEYDADDGGGEDDDDEIIR